MKNKIGIIIIILALCLATMASWFMSRSVLYPDTGIIIEVNQTEVNTYEIVYQTANGHEWSFYTEDPDWFVGDIISTIMSNQLTDDITDDVIINVKYSGTIDMYKLED